VLYIIRPDVDREEEYPKIIQKYEQVITENGGVVREVDEWGLRNFAYEIDHYDRGYYVLMTFVIDADKLPALDERFKLDEDVLRYQVVRLEDEEEELVAEARASASNPNSNANPNANPSPSPSASSAV